LTFNPQVVAENMAVAPYITPERPTPADIERVEARRELSKAHEILSGAARKVGIIMDKKALREQAEELAAAGVPEGVLPKEKPANTVDDFTEFHRQRMWFYTQMNSKTPLSSAAFEAGAGVPRGANYMDYMDTTALHMHTKLLRKVTHEIDRLQAKQTRELMMFSNPSNPDRDRPAIAQAISGVLRRTKDRAFVEYKRAAQTLRLEYIKHGIHPENFRAAEPISDVISRIEGPKPPRARKPPSPRQAEFMVRTGRAKKPKPISALAQEHVKASMPRKKSAKLRKAKAAPKPSTQTSLNM
jgi:hypothetical protein